MKSGNSQTYVHHIQKLLYIQSNRATDVCQMHKVVVHPQHRLTKHSIERKHRNQFETHSARNYASIAGSSNRAVIPSNFMNIRTEGPATSFSGSPTVSPTILAL